MTDGHTAIDDMGQNAEGSGPNSNIRVNIVGMDRPFFTAFAIVLSIMSAFYAWECQKQASMMSYWLQRNEAFLEQLSSQGVKVPQDLLTHKEKSP